MSVEDGVITVAMQGSCGSCPSQSATFEMGVDRALKARFGEKLKAVLLAGEVYKGATVEVALVGKDSYPCGVTRTQRASRLTFLFCFCSSSPPLPGV